MGRMAKDLLNELVAEVVASDDNDFNSEYVILKESTPADFLEYSDQIVDYLVIFRSDLE